MTKYNSPLFRIPLILFLFISFLGCQKEGPEISSVGFASVPVSKMIQPGLIDEASGIADSKVNAGYLWVEQDSGNPGDIILLSYSGEVFKKINIRSAVNRDWEDIAISNGPVAGTNYIYVADIGDNNKVFSQYVICRFPEPGATTDTVSVYDQIRFQYPDGSHDAEAILVDNASKDIYIITKQDSVSRIYKLIYPQNIAGINTAVSMGALSFNGVVSAACSMTNEVLIKTYSSLYYWKNSGNEGIGTVLSKAPVQLAYQQEPQGEAVCFKNDNQGFYTLSERPSFISSVNLNFYKRE